MTSAAVAALRIALERCVCEIIRVVITARQVVYIGDDWFADYL